MDERMRRTYNNTVDIIAFMKYVIKKWYYVLLAMIIGVIISIPITKLKTPLYSCEAKYYLSVSEEGFSYGSLQASSSIVDDYMTIIKSNTLIQRAIDTKKLDMDVGSVKELLSVSNPKNTHILSVKVQAQDQDLAEAVMGAISFQIVNYIPGIMEGSSLTVFEAPNTSMEDAATEKVLIVILSLIAFMLLSVLILLYRFMMKPTTDDRERIAKEFSGISTFILPKMNRKFLFGNEKKQMGLQNSMESAIEEILFSLSFEKPQSRIIMITSPMSGEGRTFLAAKLYERLKKDNIEAVLVDDDRINKSLFLPGQEEAFQDYFDKLKEKYRFIIIDASSALRTTKTLILAKYCNAIVLVVRYGKTSMLDLKRSVRRFQEKEFDVHAIVLNQYSSRKDD